MTKLYANLHHHHHQVTFKVDHRGVESMSSLSDVSDELPPPNDDVDTRQISRVYGVGRKPTTIALSFRPPQKQRFVRHKLPRLVSKTTKPNGRRPSNVTSLEGDATCGGGVSCRSDKSHVTSGRQNTGMVASKSMHSLSKTNPEVNRPALLPTSDGNGIKAITTFSGWNQAVTSSAKPKEHRTCKGLLSANWKPNRCNDSNDARSNSCPVPQLTVTSVAAADNNEAKHLACSPRHDAHSGVSDLSRRLSTPAVPSSLARPPVPASRLSPGRRESLGCDLPSKPRLDSLFNTHGDLAKFRQLLRESTDETASEQRVNYCCEVTTARIEAWLRAVRSARLTDGGLCRQTADQSLESERAMMKSQNDDHTESDVKH